MKLYHKMLFIFILASGLVFAQGNMQKYQIDFNEISGELTNKDLLKKDFGRFDGYQIDLYEGEAVHFIVYSQNFQPNLALVDAKGEIVVQSERGGKDYAEIITTVQAGGSLVLYVIGESNSAGKYILRTAIAEPNSLSIAEESAFCDKLEFILAHSTAYFSFIDNPAISKHPLVRLTGAIDVFLDEADGSYKAVYYNNNSKAESENVYKTLSETILACLGNQWVMKSNEWRKNDKGRDKSLVFEEKQGLKKRYVKIVLSEYLEHDKDVQNNYSAQIEVNRN